MKNLKELLLSVCTLFLLWACNETPANVNMGHTNVTEPKANSELQGKAFSISTTAYYKASLNSPNSEEKTVSLTLEPSGAAQMFTREVNGSSAFVADTGTWTTQNNGNLMLNLNRVGTKEAMQLEFEPDDNTLIYKGTAYGTEGLKLMVAPPPETGNK